MATPLPPTLPPAATPPPPLFLEEAGDFGPLTEQFQVVQTSTAGFALPPPQFRRHFPQDVLPDPRQCFALSQYLHRAGFQLLAISLITRPLTSRGQACPSASQGRCGLTWASFVPLLDQTASTLVSQSLNHVLLFCFSHSLFQSS